MPSNPDLFMQKHSYRHPAIGLWVPVGSQHRLLGLHGCICDVIDDTMPLFAVEIEALQKVKHIKGDNLTARQ
jgi:hypothetical protein